MKSRGSRKGKGKRKRGGSGKKERKEKKKETKKKRGEKRGIKEKRGGEKKEMKKDGRGWVEGGRGMWVLRRTGPHANNARSAWKFFSFTSPAEGQTTQTTPLTM